MPLEIATPVPEDARAISNIQWDCFASDPVMLTVCKLPAGPAERQWLADKITRTWTSRKRLIVRDTDAGEIVSVIGYNYVPATRGQAWKKAPTRPDEQLPEGMNWDVINEGHRKIWDHRVELMGPQPFLWLEAMQTDPKHGRRGAASKLVAALAADADARNLPIYLAATPPGHGLYLRHGFEDKTEFEFDLSSINEPPCKAYVMVRPAPRPGQPVDFPTSEPRPVKIVPTGKDMEAMKEFVTCADAAFGPNPLIELCFFASEQEPLEQRAQHEIKRVNSGDYIFHKAVDPEDPDGPGLGFAKWMLAKDPHVKMHPFAEEWPAGANLECCEAVFGALTSYRENHFKDRNKPYSYMCSLVVAPGAQRRGIGSALLREGLRQIDELGWDTFIDASPAGLELYKKFGWEEATQFTCQLKDFGGPDVAETVVGLLRPAGAKEKSMAEAKEKTQEITL